jgi:hypothetical protein
MRYDSYEIFVRYKLTEHTETKFFQSHESFSHAWDMVHKYGKELCHKHKDYKLMTELINTAESHHDEDDNYKYIDENENIEINEED